LASRGRNRNRSWQANTKTRSFPGCTFDVDLSTVDGNGPKGNRKPKPAPAPGASPGFIPAVEAFEDLASVFRWDAGPVVLHFDFYVSSVADHPSSDLIS